MRLNSRRLGPLVSSVLTHESVVRSIQVKFLRLCARLKLKIVGQVKIVIGFAAWEITVMEMLGESEALLGMLKLDRSSSRMMVSEGDAPAIPALSLLGAVDSRLSRLSTEGLHGYAGSDVAQFKTLCLT